MKFDILHRTRYTYASPARDSFNNVRLEPPSIPEPEPTRPAEPLQREVVPQAGS